MCIPTSHLIHASWIPPKSTSQTASRLVQPFCTAHSRVAILSPLKLTLRMRESGPPSNTCFLGPTRCRNPNSTSIGSAIFLGLTTVTDRPTQHGTPSVPTDRIYIVLLCDLKISVQELSCQYRKSVTLCSCSNWLINDTTANNKIPVVHCNIYLA